MPTTVNSAFAQFLKETVNLETERSKTARSSRDWLIRQINSLPERETDFPKLVEDFHLHYGSFARKTKTRPLDDIDIMIGLHAHGATHNVISHDLIKVYTNSNNLILNSLSNDGNTINSKMVINRFVKSLSNIYQYKSAEVNRRHEAAVLNLSSYDWSFDIVPCFQATDGYYIIPDGNGNWKKTDPRLDKSKTERINQAHDGNILNVIRIVKYWNKRRVVNTIPSYLLENMILNYYEIQNIKATSYVDMEFIKVMDYLVNAIYNYISDPKGIQGNLNNLSFDEKSNISNAALKYSDLAQEARRYEKNEDHKSAISKWSEVFGNTFPSYG
ncbi:MAG: nucleotidyltransferase [Bacteroidetes bacterium B1(2017)]|nr:MAG: nucleotidyltransferase [Bacteroidetes bacterium B1(2017)]